MSASHDFKSSNSNDSAAAVKPAYQTQSDVTYVVTRQKGVDSTKVILQMAEHIAQVVKDKASTYHFKPQNNYNVGILAYSVLDGNNKQLNRAVVALSGENNADRIAEAIWAKQGIAALVGNNSQLTVDLVTSTGMAARYYGYEARRKNIFLDVLPEEKEDLKPSTFYFVKGDNLRLFYAKKESDGVKNKTLDLTSEQQAILSAYANSASPTDEQLQALQEIIINHPDNESTYKCSEPKLAAERQKLLLFSHGFMDEGEDHFSVSSSNKIDVTPQCSCAECQSRTDQYQQPFKPLANVRMLLNNTHPLRQDKKNENQSSPLMRTKEVDRPPMTDISKKKQAEELIVEAVDLYTSSEPNTNVLAAKKWAQAMLLAGDTYEESGPQSKYIKEGRDFRAQENRKAALRELAIQWFRQEGDYHFENQKDHYQYQKALAFYTQLVPLLETQKALAIPASSATVSAVVPSDRELSLYYMKRADAQLNEVKRLNKEDESAFGEDNILDRRSLIEACKRDYRAALLQGLDAKDLAKNPMWVKAQVEYCCQLELHTEPALKQNLATLVSKAIELNKNISDLYIYQALVGEEKNVDGLVIAIKEMLPDLNNLEQHINKFCHDHQLKRSTNFDQLIKVAVEKINKEKQVVKTEKMKQKKEIRDEQREKTLQEQAKQAILIREKDIENALKTFDTEITRHEIIYKSTLEKLKSKAVAMQKLEEPKALTLLEKSKTQSQEKLVTTIKKLLPDINLQELRKKIENLLKKEAKEENTNAREELKNLLHSAQPKADDAGIFSAPSNNVSSSLLSTGDIFKSLSLGSPINQPDNNKNKEKTDEKAISSTAVVVSSSSIVSNEDSIQGDKDLAQGKKESDEDGDHHTITPHF